MLAGGESLFGVVGMAGNVYEFEETTVDLLNLDAFARRGANGGTFNSTLAALASDFRNSGGPFASQSRGGIRIVSVPEPNCLLMILLGLPLLPGVFRKRA
jgi:hypothetical protein